jgi:adenylate cyclase
MNSPGLDAGQSRLAEPLERVRAAILVVDLVESVRLMQADEAGTITRWRHIVQETRQRVLPPLGGRLVKSLGDGMLLSLPDASSAVQAAKGIQAAVDHLNAQRPTDAEALSLRLGAHVCDFVVDAQDIYGRGVNLAARVAALGRPGDLTVTAELRDELINGLDAELEDLGACYVKHVDQPVRTFRAAAPSSRAAEAKPPPQAAHMRMQPTLAVLPLAAAAGTPASALADLLCAELIALLGPTGHWQVLSQLSTGALKNRALSPQEAGRLTGADYVLMGQCQASADQLQAVPRLVAAATGQVLWSAEFNRPIDDPVPQAQALALHVARALTSAILGRELDLASNAAMPHLQSYTLLFRCISLMHGSHRDSVLQAQQGLEYLIERNPRAPEPRVWMAKCHVLRVAHGELQDPQAEARRAQQHLRLALEEQPRHALAHTMLGHVTLYIERKLDAAEQCYQQALAFNPSESMAWLFQSSIHAHRGHGQEALDCVARARRLSPLDPLDHYFHGFTAWAALAAGDYALAEEQALLAKRSHCTHLPTFLTLAQAQALLGKLDAAREHAKRLVQLRPSFCVSHYLEGYPGGAHHPFAHRLGQALRLAGIPDCLA